MARYPLLDIDGFIGFSLVPNDVGAAGQIDYWVGQDRILTAGNPADFAFLMQQVIQQGVALSVEKWATLYGRFYLMKRTMLLWPDMAKMFPGQADFFDTQWTPPVFRQDSQGLVFDCWLLNTDSFVPFRVKGNILANGELIVT